jgi:tetratricopeptide (TPR) repeat protein
LRALIGRAAITVAVVVFAGACAARTSSRFVVKDGGFVDVGGPAPQAEHVVSPEELQQAIREAVTARAAEKQAGPRSIEETDPTLKLALAALATRPSADAHAAVAGHYSRLGVSDMAYEHLSQALVIEPTSSAALDSRARLLRDVGLMAMALADANRAKFNAPGSATVRNTLGTILERLGQCREALAAYREAARLSHDADWARGNASRLSASCPG